MTDKQTLPVKHHYRACHLCEAICGLVIQTQGQDIISIKGDPDDPLSRGHICPKAIALQDMHNDPDRLQTPMKRLRDQGDGTQWVSISWDEALDTVVSKVLEIRDKYGADAFGAYFGNPAVHNYGMLTHQKAFFSYLKTRNRFSATSVDQLPHHLTSLWLYGHKDLLPIADIDHTDYFLMLGANPMVSNGSIMTVPNIRKRLKALRARGGKLVTVDPRRTQTAELADQHYFIKPGTDALLLLAIVNTLFTEELTDYQRYGDMIAGLDTVKEAIAYFTADVAAPRTGIAAEAIRTIARDMAGASRAICYGRMGVSVQAFGAMNHWLIQLINIITGNLDRPGGILFTTPAVDSIPSSNPGKFANVHSRVSKQPSFTGELPAAVMAEEILTPGDGQLRALFTAAGNPVLSTPNGRQLDRALASLDFMVSLDPYINETTRHADIILPPTLALEHDHYDIAFHINAVRNTTRFNEAVFEKPPGSLHDWEIFSELGERVANALGEKPKPRSSPKEMMAFALAIGPYSEKTGHPQQLTMEQLLQTPSGIDLGPLQSSLPERLLTPDKRIHCDHPEVLNDLQRVMQCLIDVPDNTDTLLLIGRRHVRSNNSWMHNYHRLVKGKERCTLLMNPYDIKAKGLASADQVKVVSRTGEVCAIIEASEEIMPGVVSLPHGWGHNRTGIQMRTAEEHAGVSVNDLTDEKFCDQLSGNAALNGVPVQVFAR